MNRDVAMWPKIRANGGNAPRIVLLFNPLLRMIPPGKQLVHVN